MSAHRKQRKSVWQRLEDHEAVAQFNCLAHQGADRSTLLGGLGLLVQHHANVSSFEERFGFKRHQARTRAGQIRRVADLLEKILSPSIAASLIWQADHIQTFRDAERVGIENGHFLGRLRSLAGRIQNLLQEMPPRTKVTRALIICALVQHVQRTTGRPHYGEVASLIGAVLNKPGYDSQTLKSFCSDHRDLTVLASRANLRLLFQFLRPR